MGERRGWRDGGELSQTKCVARSLIENPVICKLTENTIKMNVIMMQMKTNVFHGNILLTLFMFLVCSLRRGTYNPKGVCLFKLGKINFV